MKQHLTLFAAVALMLVLLAGCGDQAGEAPSETSLVSVDLDLTALSSTMVYGEVFNMMVEPDSYVGKTIRMRGLYYASYYDVTEQYYHFVIIQDATACCAQGLEFLWTGEHTYPDDYPENETKVEVTGVWERYEEDGEIYYRIQADDFHIV